MSMTGTTVATTPDAAESSAADPGERTPPSSPGVHAVGIHPMARTAART
jgi:hypothetical protein